MNDFPEKVYKITLTNGEMAYTLNFYKVPKLEDFNRWCSERNFIYHK